MQCGKEATFNDLLYVGSIKSPESYFLCKSAFLSQPIISKANSGYCDNMPCPLL
jgi:hypothetical protein